MGMNYDPTQFETWRPNFELKQSMTWFAGCIGFTLAGSFAHLSGAAMACAAVCAGMGLWKFKPACRRYAMTLRLAGTPLPYVDFKDLRKILSDKVHTQDMWLGRGFNWGPTQTQRIAELMKRDWDKTYREALGSLYLVKYLRTHLVYTLFHPFKSRHDYQEEQKRVASQQGYPWIHGVGDGEADIYQPISHSEGHTFIIGTTGSGKTRCFDLFISQAILRGEPVFIIDPKGDKDLMEKARQACIELGHGDKFLSFHPAFPEQSIRINLLSSWTRSSEIADRISALMPAQSDSDPFKSFAFGALNTVCAALTMIYRNPTLKNLNHYLAGAGSGALSSLVIDTIDKYVRESLPDGKKLIDDKVESIPLSKRNEDTIAAALIEFYQQLNIPNPDVDGLCSLYTHNREHFGKMITSLLPVLNMLTSGRLGDMLSPPDGASTADKSTWWDTEALINSNFVVYVGLDSLSDPLVGSAIGSLFLSDLACMAGSRYNYDGTEPNPEEVKKTVKARVLARALGKSPTPDVKNGAEKINVFVDEAAEVVNGPFLQLLNKGRGAGFRLFVATQTIADFESRMGSKAKAIQLLGNLNNRISLRCVDPDTQKFVVSSLPKTMVKSITRSQGLSTTAFAPVPNGGSLGERQQETEVPIFPPELLGMLPNLEFVASLSGGHIVKGRYPLILKDKSEFRPG